ncbi:MAG: radical SAM protein [Pseudomonadota bacterium]
MDGFQPAYMSLFRDGALADRVRAALDRLRSCDLCPRRCGADRHAGEFGLCRIGRRARVASAFPHHGEEPMIRGTSGSGTVFLSGCSLHCRFCQNWETSHGDEGSDATAGDLAGHLLRLERLGCHNWNLVTPTHVAPQLLEGLLSFLLTRREARLPIVWNTGGYDTLETLALLDGVVDVYMPDLKSLDPGFTGTTMAAQDYPEVAAAALDEMVRQTGPVTFGPDSVLRRGVLIRHLVMPGRGDDSRRVLEHVAARFGRSVAVNVMGQYRPCGRAGEHPGLDRALPREEWDAAARIADALDLRPT